MSSVLKGLKPRVPGNIKAEETFKELKKESSAAKSQGEQKKKTTFENQAHQIKLSEQLKSELNAVKAITKMKYDYEVIEMMIDTYVKEAMTPPQRRRFNLLTKDDFM